MKKLIFLTILTPYFFLFGHAYSQGQTEAGLTLLEPSGARAAAMGEAFSAVQNDVTALNYNPATLDTLKSSHASFLYQSGLADDTFGQIQVGLPTDKHTFGFSAGYYSSAKIDAYDGVSQRSVTGQKDLNLNVGYATSFGKVSVGFTGKYLSSELGETAKATAIAGDLGLVTPVSSRVHMGMAIQNIGNEMKYESEGDPLPRIGRVGFSWLLGTQKNPTTLLLDAPYYMNQHKIHPSAGLEYLYGPMALRAGYKSGSDLKEFSVGTGFTWGPSTLDYSFGFADKLDSLHRMSYSMRFGHIVGTPQMEISKETPKEKEKKAEVKNEVAPIVAPKREAFEIKPLGGQQPTHKVYIVQPGDTLKSISKRYYGRADMWEKIYQANHHLISNPDNLVQGQKLLLPQKANNQ